MISTDHARSGEHYRDGCSDGESARRGRTTRRALRLALALVVVYGVAVGWRWGQKEQGET